MPGSLDAGGRTPFTIEQFLGMSGAGPSSLETYRRQLRHVEGWLAKPLWETSQRDLLELKKRLRGLASGKQFCTLLRMFYRAAALATDDVAYLKLREFLVLKQRVRRLAPTEVLAPGEVRALVEAATTMRDRALIACLWETGVRVHELLALDLGDLHLRESPENGGRRIYVLWFKKTKVAGEEHQGFIIEAGPVLEAWLKAHPSPVPTAPLFPSWGGGRLGRNGALLAIKRAAVRAGMTKRVYPHLFRHSRSTYLLRQGVPEQQVKRLLGWAPSSVMLNRYAHLTSSDAYVALLKAEGLQPPERVDLERLSFAEQELRPVVPMNPPPGARAAAIGGMPASLGSTPVGELAKAVAEELRREAATRPPPAWASPEQWGAALQEVTRLQEELRGELQRLRKRP